jgi:hypothetical protein
MTKTPKLDALRALREAKFARAPRPRAPSIEKLRDAIARGVPAKRAAKRKR